MIHGTNKTEMLSIDHYKPISVDQTAAEIPKVLHLTFLMPKHSKNRQMCRLL